MVLRDLDVESVSDQVINPADRSEDMVSIPADS